MLSGQFLLEFTAGLVVAGLLFLIVARHERLTLYILLGTTLLAGQRDIDLRPTAQFGSVSVYVTDILLVAFFGISAMRWRQRRLSQLETIALISLTGLVLLAVVTWTLSDGLETGVMRSRYWLLFTSLICWVMTAPRLWKASDLSGVVAAAWGACALFVYGLARGGLGSNAGQVLVDGQFVSARPINSTAALMVLTGLWVVVLVSRGHWVLRFASATTFAAVVVLSQHRSVWVAAAASGFIVVIVLARRKAGWAWDRLTLYGFAAGLSVIAISSVLRASSVLSQSAQDGRTWAWRVEGWGERLATKSGVADWLVGGSLGTSESTRLDAFATSAHSMYIEPLVSIGVLGAGLMWIVVGSLVIRASPNFRFVAVVFTALLAFGVAYQWPMAVVAVLVVAAAVAFDRDTRRPLAGHEHLKSNEQLSPTVTDPRSDVRSGAIQ